MSIWGSRVDSFFRDRGASLVWQIALVAAVAFVVVLLGDAEIF